MKVSKYLGRADSQLVSCRPRMNQGKPVIDSVSGKRGRRQVFRAFVQRVKKGLEPRLTEGTGHGAQQPRRDTRRRKYSAFQELVLSAGVFLPVSL